MKKRTLSILLVTILILGIFTGCGKSSDKTSTVADGEGAEKRYSLNVATLTGASSYVPAYMCEENGNSSSELWKTAILQMRGLTLSVLHFLVVQ